MPRQVHIMPTGLAIYETMFVGLDGSRGCIGGPHELFTKCEKQFLQTNTAKEFRAFLYKQLKLFNTGYKVCLDYDSLSSNQRLQPHTLAVFDKDKSSCSNVLLSSNLKGVGEADSVGSEIEYRCVKCRGCNDCKNGESIEKISLREEREQYLIDQSVSIDFDKNETIASLPFTADPAEKLSSNEENAIKVYNQQLRKLKNNPNVKKAVLKAEFKLQENGHVEWTKNLSEEEVSVLNGQAAKYFMPWRFVYNENSASTPVRIVFDASSVSRSGYSLNDLLAKGINSLNSLLEIFIRFRCSAVALHADIEKI